MSGPIGISFGEIARGGMGAVLKGRDVDLGRDLALKVLLESHAAKPELVKRFVEEAQIGGQLQHPGIVPVYGLGTFLDRRPYFTMKLVKGRTLYEILTGRILRRRTWPRLLSIFESVCQTIAYAHSRGVIHRDLKPSNVMVGSFGEVQVMDWGLAKVLPRGSSDHNRAESSVEPVVPVSVIQRPGRARMPKPRRPARCWERPATWLPNRRGEIDALDERTDVFGLGSILSEILTGEPAFIGRSSDETLRKAGRGEVADALVRLNACAPRPS